MPVRSDGSNHSSEISVHCFDKSIALSMVLKWLSTDGTVLNLCLSWRANKKEERKKSSAASWLQGESQSERTGSFVCIYSGARCKRVTVEFRTHRLLFLDQDISAVYMFTNCSPEHQPAPGSVLTQG